eukprot:COSAG04_NODE_3848_length_2476_cov_1.286075_1_plen_98_part_10
MQLDANLVGSRVLRGLLALAQLSGVLNRELIPHRQLHRDLPLPHKPSADVCCSVVDVLVLVLAHLAQHLNRIALLKLSLPRLVQDLQVDAVAFDLELP